MGIHDVIIVGAGPAGSALAALMARRGFDVLLLDRAAFPRDKACGEYTSPETEKVLARLGVFDAVLNAGARRIPSMRVISPSGRAFSMDYSAPDTPDGPHVLATPRRILDATLVEHALSCGAKLMQKAKVEAVVMRDGKAGGVVVRRSGRTTSEEQARLIVGADGVHSAVVRSLGLSAPLRWPQNLGMVAHYRDYSGLDAWGEMHVSARGYAGLAPLSGGLLNVGLVMPMKSARSTGGGAQARFESFANSFPGVAKALNGAERVSNVRGVGPIGARVKRTSGPGYMLVGDAAGFFDPFTGEGVYKALRGAEIASQVATDALERDDLSVRSLARYSVLRRKEFAAKDLVCRLVQLFVGLPPAMDYVTARLSRRDEPRKVLTGVLGDFADARAALSPLYLWSLLRP
ncbi:MAG TPA: NAD(P)/FAD-dependent oxidoreductase [Chloroflexia bacterium]|nr:NAD(P)/FAD-dependent oxidoreductase [Chloroflexia bacterium]